MVAYLMATSTNFLKQMRIFDGILTYHKEGGFGIEAVQCIKDKGSCLWDRTVIKGQVH